MSQHAMRKQVTLRGLPDGFLKEVKSEARRQGISINRVLFKKLIPEERGKEEKACTDLISLGGTWTAERAEDFERQFRGHRRIDPEIWS